MVKYSIIQGDIFKIKYSTIQDQISFSNTQRQIFNDPQS